MAKNYWFRVGRDSSTLVSRMELEEDLINFAIKENLMSISNSWVSYIGDEGIVGTKTRIYERLGEGAVVMKTSERRNLEFNGDFYDAIVSSLGLDEFSEAFQELDRGLMESY